MTTLQAVELGVLGPLQVRQDCAPVIIPGAKPRAILTMLGLQCGSVVSADTLVGLLWGEDPPRTAAKALQTHISSLRRTLGDGATYIDHRQLAADGINTVADHLSSIRTMASLVSDLWIEPAEILTHSALGFVTHLVMKGTSTEGLAIELPLVVLTVLDGDRVARIETFDADQRDLALARFEELNRSG